MLLGTIKSKLNGELRWLREFYVTKKKAELWNVIGELIEQLRFQNFKPEQSHFVFSRFSAGITFSTPEAGSGRFRLIASVKPWDFPEFREIWGDIERSSHSQQEKAINPLVEHVFRQVYGNHT